jgi:hypothetical protein
MILWKIGLGGSYTGVSVHEVNAHGHAQIMGWVGLFIMGFAYQAFPRMWQVELPAPWLALASWVALLAGIACRSTAMMFSEAAWAMSAHQCGVVLQIAAVTAFIGQLLTAFLRSGQPVKPYVGFAFAALVFFFIQTVYSGWHVSRLMAAADRDTLLDQLATYQSPLRDIQIHGLALLMILAVGMRMFPTLLGVRSTPDRRAWLALALLATAVPLEVGLFLAYRLTGWHAVAGLLLLPWLLLPIGVWLVIGPWRLWRPLPEPGRSDRSGKFVRIAFGWLFLSLAMLLLLPVYQVISGIAFSHAYYGSVRHAITVGFISMMIVAMAAKVVPTLRGIDAKSLPALWWPFVLINVGCLMRVVFQIGTDWHPVFFALVGVSGMFEWTGLAIWSWHLAAIMLGLGRFRQPVTRDWGPAPQRFAPHDRVAAVLSWCPEVESVFVDFGFDLVRNPVLRRTVARQVSLSQACRMRHVDVTRFLNALHDARRDRDASSSTCDPAVSMARASLTIAGHPIRQEALHG